MKNRQTIETLVDVEEAMNELQKLEAQMATEVADANTKIAVIRASVTPEITSLEERVTRLRNSLETWAHNNRQDDELFPEGRKTLLKAGIISFRTGAQSVTIKKGWDTEDVVEAAKDLGIKSVLKQPAPELDKTAVKKLYNQGKIEDNDLKKLGLEITQTESVTITLKTFERYEA